MAAASGFEMIKADSLVPDPRNSRTHSDQQLEQLKASLDRFGFANTVGYRREGDELVLVYGHARWTAAQALWAAGSEVLGPGKRQPLPKGKLPAIDLTGLSEEEIRAYVIADNQLALNAGWDMDVLAEEMRFLDEAGFDLGVVGFDGDFLADLLAVGTEGETDPNAAPPVEDVVVSRPGDLWVLGDHRLLCGSSTVATDVERVLEGRVPQLMATDPPYGVNYDPSWRQDAGLASASAATGKVTNDDQADWREAWALFPGPVAYVWHGGLHAGAVAQSLEAVKLLPRAQIIWVKPRAAISRGAYHWQHEPLSFAVREGEDVASHWQDREPEGDQDTPFADDHEAALYAVRKGKTARWRGGRKQTTVWNIEHLKCDTGHGTQKPVECMRRPILNNSAPGQLVYEPFSGSGTTIIAGEMEARPVAAIEIDPAYVDVAVRRWQSFTGKQAFLVHENGDRSTFDELAAQRSAPPPAKPKAKGRKKADA